MSGAAARRTAFLDAMGIAPLWTLRRPASPSGAGAHGDRSAASTVMGEAASHPQLAPPDAGVAMSPRTEGAVAVGAAAVPTAVRPDAPPPVVSPSGSASVAQLAVAPADSDPVAAMGGDASTAWFDDASAPPPLSDAAIAAMDWPQLRAAVAACTRCDRCQTRRRAVAGRGPSEAGWLVLGSAPSRADEAAGSPLSGEAGALLDNMLRATGLAPERDVYVTSLVKCRAADGRGADRAPTPDEIARCRPFLMRELALSQARTVLAVGQAAVHGLQDGAGRGSVLAFEGRALVATYHPDKLLRRGADKAKAWADLCMARQAHDGRG